MWVLQQPWKSQYTSCKVVLQNLACADPAVRFSGDPRVIDFSVLCSSARNVVAIFIDCTTWIVAPLHACSTIWIESHNFAGQLHVWAVRTHMDSSCAVLSLEMSEWHMITVILGSLFQPLSSLVVHTKARKSHEHDTHRCLLYLKWPLTARLRIQYICFCSWCLL